MLPSDFVIAGNVATPEAVINRQGSINDVGGHVPGDLKRVNCVVPGGENAGEHLFM